MENCYTWIFVPPSMIDCAVYVVMPTKQDTYGGAVPVGNEGRLKQHTVVACHTTGSAP